MRCAVWTEAAKFLSNFDEAVLTVLDVEGYPVSVRLSTPNYDATTGELPATLLEALGAVAGPAGLLCHYHDEKLWSLNVVHVKGRLEKRGGDWVFVSTRFTAPPRVPMWGFMTNLRASGQKYLDKRTPTARRELGCYQTDSGSRITPALDRRAVKFGPVRGERTFPE
jgi:hypothetical protein